MNFNITTSISHRVRFSEVSAGNFFNFEDRNFIRLEPKDFESYNAVDLSTGEGWYFHLWDSVHKYFMVAGIKEEEEE